MSIKYIHTSDVHNLNAPLEIVPYLIKEFNPKSVVDIGCGIATFLHVFQQQGVTDVIGVDGSWVDKKKLMIAEEKFIESDLEMPININRKFDLVLSLEVAEHLKEESADIFVKSLVSLGNIIIFSAAVTNQGGQNHINEQDFAYWKKKFESLGFIYYDIFRKKFWNNNQIDWWYRQNMFLVAHESVSFSAEIQKCKIDGDPLIYIHPGTLSTRLRQIEHLLRQEKSFSEGDVSLGLYVKGILRKIKKRITASFLSK